MNSIPLKTLATAAFGAAALLLGGCSKSQPVAQSGSMPTPTAASRTVPPASAAVTPVPLVSPGSPPGEAVTATWDSIRGFTYEQRADFAAGLVRMENALDGQISELAAKRAAMTTDTKDWDFAMRELTVAQAYLKSTADEAARASPETWSQEKDKVAEAWQKAQTAVDKVKNSTTS